MGSADAGGHAGAVDAAGWPPPRRITELLGTTAAIVAATGDVETALQWALDVVCTYTAWPVGHILTVHAGSGVLSSAGIWHVDDPARHQPFVEASRTASFAPGEGLPGRIAVTGEPAWIFDVREDPNFLRCPAAAAAGLGAGFGFPITSGRGIEGVMEFFAPAPMEPDEPLLGLIAHVGSQLGQLLDRSRAEQALRASEVRLAEAERVGRAGSWSWTVGEPILTWSPELYRIHGADPASGPVACGGYLDMVHPDDREALVARHEEILRTMDPYEQEYRIVRPDGEVRWVHGRVGVVARRDGVVERLAGQCVDVTERRLAEDARRLSQLELESQRRILERIVRSEPVAPVIEDLCRDVEARYDGVRCSVLLVDPAGRVLRHVAAPSLPESFRRAIDGLPVGDDGGACGRAAARNQTVVVVDALADPLTAGFVDLALDQGLRSVWSHPLTTAAGEVIGTFALYRETPYRPDECEIQTVRSAANLAALALERDRTQAALTAAANVDPLTGLANRTRFLEEVEDRMGHPGTCVAVMFLDLDGFKWINDSLGHPAGDRILQEVAARLRQALGPRHHVARFGGDEFTVLLEDAAPDVIERAAGQVSSAFVEPFLLDGGEFFLSCGAGTAVNDHPTDAYGLIRDADTAMFSAKEAGRGHHAVFDRRLRARAVGRVTLESELRRAVERDELVMHYQPILDLRSGAWVGVEALVRWQHPTRGLVPPSEFIPLAEENGLIVPLGLRVLDAVLADRASWPAPPGFYASVNVSAAQLADPAIGAAVARSLHTHDVAPDLLVVEVTETAVMQQLETAQAALQELDATGVRVVIDDFGAGYSSIARLGDLPVAGIKIDSRFTTSLGTDRRAPRVFGAIADLAHALDLPVVAEGIETEAARVIARALACEFGQGYHLSRPVPTEQMDGILAAGGP